MPRVVSPLLRKSLAGLGGLLLAIGPAPGRAAAKPAGMPAVPVSGHVETAPETASLRIKGALFGHADLKPRRPDYEPQFRRPDLGHPALARFSLYDARGSVVDSTAYPTDGIPLNTLLSDEARRTADAAAPTDPGFAAYLALPESQRAQDLLVAVQPGDTWNVPEYQTARGRGIPYNSGYVVHFAPAGGGTEIQVLGYGSRLKTGSSWHRLRGGDGLGLPYSYGPDMQPVAPSLADRRALLAVLVRLAGTGAPP